jgi:hypothetical protein
MAVGDITWFRAGLLALGTKLINLSADTIKLGLIKSAANSGIDPTNILADPRWGAGGTTNLATSQVNTGTSYVTGGPTLTTKTFDLQANVPTMRADIVTIAQDASGFTNARWGILYESVTLRALAFIDLGTDRSVVGGELKIDWSGASNDILTIS